MTAFGKHPALIVRQREPFNAGPPLHLLGRSFITPTDLFFVRNHGPVPAVDPTRYRLTVDGLVRTPLSLSLDDLRARFPAAEATVTLQCAGNRRRELMAVRPIPGELEWDCEAIGTAHWRGLPLREVLRAAGVERGAAHVAFKGLDEVVKAGRNVGFGGSIPLEKAESPEVLLAYEMNGEPLPPVHGFPLRVVVPGYIGARSVKWLAGLTIQPAPSDNYFQTSAYKVFPPHVSAGEADWSAGESLGPFPLSVAVLQPRDGERHPAGPLVVRGYAVSGRGAVTGVEVSLDGGRSWGAARILEGGSVWAWALWEFPTELRPGAHVIVARGRDTTGHPQPADPAGVWNVKGYVNNAWHRITIQAE